VILGVDPGANCGLAFCRRRDLQERGRFAYVVAHHSTVKTDTALTVAERVKQYRVEIARAIALFGADSVRVEVPWRYGRRGLSVYTRDGRNVGGIALLLAITGCVMTVCHELGVPVVEVPAPTGYAAKGWEKQRETVAKQLTGIELRKHEAVACCLAIGGL
jgi:Holliday junction resolvasome RuvABC endonuclease subunit